MSQTNSIIAQAPYPVEGNLPVNMTNDLLFHLLLQDEDSKDILKGIISAFYEIAFEDIRSVIVTNPISYGDTIDSKEMVLDIKALLNDYSIINLETQVNNYKNWPERSISYLCRCFDNLKPGDGYVSVKGAYHIGFLNYTLFDDTPDFFATYSIRNDVTNRLYSSKFRISVIDLTLIDKATDEDKCHHRDLWAYFFKATTWEEIHMLATKDQNIHTAASKLFKITEDQKIRDEIWAREDHIRCMNDFNNYYKNEIAERDAAISAKDAVISAKVFGCKHMNFLPCCSFEKICP